MNLVQRLLGVLFGVLFLIAVLIFAALAAGVLVAGGLALWGWLWWRTRLLRREGRVIDGEYRDETPRLRL